jgi:lysophospholipase L1-like esterase
MGGDGQFSEDIRWTGILKKQFACSIENHGICGRCIPHTEGQIKYVLRQLDRWQEREAPVWLWMMLGTNDLLEERSFTAEDVVLRMKNFLETLTKQPSVLEGKIRLLLMAPPKMQRGAWVDEERLLTESKKLGRAYQKVADLFGIPFVDCSSWEIPLAFDGVHISEEGHRIFADKIACSTALVHCLAASVRPGSKL